MKKLKEIYKLYKAYKELKRIRSQMSEIEYYTGVEKDDDPRFPLRYDELIKEREEVIRGLSWI
jgi:hypothetical protein